MVPSWSWRRALAHVVVVATVAGSGAALAPAPAAAAAVRTCFGQPATLVGTDGDDVLVGTDAADVIAAGPGDDVVDGGGGADLICGESGDDELSLSIDAGSVDGGSGDDRVHGGPMADTLRGGEGNDRVHGEEGDDSLSGDEGVDTLVGGLGDDLLAGGDGVDTLDGGQGADELQGGPGADHADGGTGNDVLIGDRGEDTLVGGLGTDALDGGPAADVCREGEHLTNCETTEDSPLVSLADRLGPAPPGVVDAGGFDGVQVQIASPGGIYPWDLHIGRDPVLTARTADVMASPAYDISLRNGAPFDQATITIPYDEAALGGFPEEQLQILWMDESIGLWVAPGGAQHVDPVANTVSVEVEHFSAYAVFMLDEEGFERYWAETSVFCVQSGSGAGGVDVAFVVDTSGSMAWYDPDARRVEAAKLFVDEMTESDRAAVVDFDSSARVIRPLTQLDDETAIGLVKSSLDATRNASGGTNITAAVSTAVTELTRDPRGVDVPRIAVLLTDGESSYDTSQTDRAREEGVVIYTVGLGDSVNSALLRDIATGTGGRYLHLEDAADLPALYEELARSIIDDGTDSDDDGLTDCEETYGMLVSWGFYDTSFDPTENEPFVGDHRITSDPNDPDTDDDDLTDGEELLGRPLGDPLDLRDYPVAQDLYGFLIEAGIHKYFVMRSDPNRPESDGDGVSDYDETIGLDSGGRHYTSRADRPDTDFDGNDDDVEYAIGTDPRVPDAFELGIPGLPANTLFQPYDVDAPIVPYRYDWQRSDDVQVVFNPNPVVFEVGSWDCLANCSALEEAAANEPDTSGWCFLPGRDCENDEEQVRELVELVVERQRVFDDDGALSEEYVQDRFLGDCVALGQDPDACFDQYEDHDFDPVDEDVLGELLDGLEEALFEALLNLPGGYRQPCDDPNASGGVYELVDPQTNQVVYTGRTNNFTRRAGEHRRDPRLGQYDFREKYFTDDPLAQRGLEQRNYNDLWGDVDIATAQAQGSLNRQRPLSSGRVDYGALLDLAGNFIDGVGC